MGDSGEERERVGDSGEERGRESEGYLLRMVSYSDRAVSPGNVVDIRFQLSGFVSSSKGPADITGRVSDVSTHAAETTPLIIYEGLQDNRDNCGGRMWSMFGIVHTQKEPNRIVQQDFQTKTDSLIY